MCGEGLEPYTEAVLGWMHNRVSSMEHAMIFLRVIGGTRPVCGKG